MPVTLPVGVLFVRKTLPGTTIRGTMCPRVLPTAHSFQLRGYVISELTLRVLSFFPYLAV